MSGPPTSADPAALSPEAARPVPRRYWWLKRILLLWAGLILLVALSRWWWGVHASRALQAEIDRLRAAGEPLEAKDFDLPPVPDEMNAAIPLREAAAIQAQLEAQKPRRPRRLPGQPVTTMPEDPKLVQARAEGMARIRELVHEARLRSSLNWGSLPRGLGSSPQMDLMQFDAILQELQESAIASARAGDGSAACELLLDMLSLSQRVAAQRTLPAALLQNAGSNMVCDALQQIFPDLRLAAHNAPAMDGPLIHRDRVTALMEQLLDDRPLREAMMWGIQSERMFQLDAIRLASAGQARTVAVARYHPWPFLLQPMFELDGVRIHRYATASVEMAKAKNLPQSRSHKPSLPRVKPGLKMQSRWLSMLVIPNHEGLQDRFFESLGTPVKAINAKTAARLKPLTSQTSVARCELPSIRKSSSPDARKRIELKPRGNQAQKMVSQRKRCASGYETGWANSAARRPGCTVSSHTVAQ